MVVVRKMDVQRNCWTSIFFSLCIYRDNVYFCFINRFNEIKTYFVINRLLYDVMSQPCENDHR